MNINELELASELASLKLTDYVNTLSNDQYKEEFPQGLIIDITGEGNCATTSYKQHYNHFVKEDSKCIWFEDFAAHYSVYVEVPWYCIPERLKDTVEPKRIYVKTEEELFNAIEYFSLNYIGMNFYINTNLPEYKTSKDVLKS